MHDVTIPIPRPKLNLDELPESSPLRSLPLIMVGAEAMYNCVEDKSIWRPVRSDWRIAKYSFNDLGPAWVGSMKWRCEDMVFSPTEIEEGMRLHAQRELLKKPNPSMSEMLLSTTQKMVDLVSAADVLLEMLENPSHRSNVTTMSPPDPHQATQLDAAWGQFKEVLSACRTHSVSISQNRVKVAGCPSDLAETVIPGCGATISSRKPCAPDEGDAEGMSMR